MFSKKSNKAQLLDRNKANSVDRKLSAQRKSIAGYGALRQTAPSPAALFTRQSTGSPMSRQHHQSINYRDTLASSASRITNADAAEELTKKGCRNWGECIRKVLDNPWFTVLNLILTSWALFANDARLAVSGCDRSFDPIFDWVNVMIISLFALEIILCTACKSGYFMGFFFMLDCLATITMIFDIQYFTNFVFLDGSEDDFGDSGR